MKKCRMFLLALALLLLCACGSTEEEPAEVTAMPDSVATEAPETAKPVSTQMGSGVFDAFSAEFVGAECFAGEDGTQILRVYFDFVNRSDSAISPMELLQISAVQDGHTLGWAADADSSEDSNLSLRLQPGYSARCVLQYALVSESTVAVMLDDTYGHAVSALFSIGQLPGAPAQPLPQETSTSEQTLTTDLPAECTLFDLYTATLLGGEKSEDGSILTVSVDFTNTANPNSIESFAVFTLSAYQNGVELAAVEEPEPIFPTADPDTTVNCEIYFSLHDDSPVLVELYAFREDTPSAALVIPVE